jgi:hypothetical protein
MKIYDEYPFGLIHVTKNGLVRITLKEETFVVPRGDEIVCSIQPTYSANIEIAVRTKLSKNWRINYGRMLQNASVRSRWMRLKELKSGDEVIFAGSIGPVFENGKRVFDDPEFVEVGIISSGKEIVLEHVPSQHEHDEELRKEKEEKRQKRAEARKAMDKKVSFERQLKIRSLFLKVTLSTSPSMTLRQVSRSTTLSLGIIRRISDPKQWMQLHAKSWLRAEKAFLRYLASGSGLATSESVAV